MLQTYHVRAPAKVNLRLKVVGRRQDGFHLLSMLNAPIDLADRLSVTFTPSPDVRMKLVEFGDLTSDSAAVLKQELMSNNNLMVKTALFCRGKLGFTQGMELELRKNIPMGAGLGGGSSDAGTLARFLFEHFGGTDPEFAAALSKLGSDIPYCFYSAPALVNGVGEIVRLLPPKIVSALFDKKFILLLPKIHLPSALVYNRYREIFPTLKEKSDDPLPKLITCEDVDQIWHAVLDLIENDLENGIPDELGALTALLTHLRKNGFKTVMTGSGSALCIFPEGQNLHPLIEEIGQLSRDVGVPAELRICSFA